MSLPVFRLSTKLPKIKLKFPRTTSSTNPLQVLNLVRYNYSSSNLTDNKVSDIEYSKVKRYWENLEQLHSEPSQYFEPSPMSSPRILNPGEVIDRVSKLVELSSSKRGDMVLSLSSQSVTKYYESLATEDKLQFSLILQRYFGLEDSKVRSACKDYLSQSELEINQTSLKSLRRLQMLLRHSLVPKYVKVFESVVQLPLGMKYLVNYRQDLLYFIKKLAKHNGKESQDQLERLQGLSDSLKFKLQTWLVGFQDLEPITWSSPAFTLEKLFRYEKVHRFKNWDDLKQYRRVGPGRRIFGFFHKSLPLDPLVYVQVALLQHISSNVQTILNQKDPAHPTLDTVKVALFYSINTQSGLTGVDLGSFLIKRVVAVLQTEFPNLNTFCTLSPIPQLRPWLLNTLNRTNRTPLSQLERYLDREEVQLLDKLNVTGKDKWTNLSDLLTTDAWIQDASLYPSIKPVLMRVASYYLLEVKQGQFPYDPVAAFHLRNGANLHRINWMGDTSAKGVSESFGMMVNYNYLLQYIEVNNHHFLTKFTIAISAPQSDRYFARYVDDPRFCFRTDATN